MLTIKLSLLDRAARTDFYLHKILRGKLSYNDVLVLEKVLVGEQSPQNVTNTFNWSGQ